MSPSKTRPRRRTVAIRPPKKRAPRQRRSRTPRPGVLTGALALLAAGIVVAAVLSLREDAPAAQTTERTVTVSRGVIESIVSGSGNLEAARQAELDFGTSGRLRKLDVEEGQHVSKGELLGRIDDRSQRVAVARAQADLVDARDALESAVEADANTETASTEAVQLRLVSAQVTPAPTTAPAPAETPSPTATPTASAPTPTATAPAAPSSSGSAGSSSQQGGGATVSVESAQAAVASAELALDEAEDDLEETRLRAPMAGTVASISGAVGDTVGSGSSSGGADPAGGGDTSAAATGSSFITLVALSRLKLEVALSEADIGKVEVGQSAKVSINAASGEQVAGEVTKVGVLSSAATSGSVSYPVEVSLKQSTDGIRTGMSATADIIVDRASGLTVPSQALRGSMVTVERDGGRATQRVQTGVVGESMTEVVSGLEAGDRVIVTSTSAAQGATAGQQPAGGAGAAPGGGGFGGGRGGFGGGGLGGGPPGGGFGGGGPGGP